MKPIVGLLLAAGSSRRFGSDKLLHPLGNGETLVAASARRLVDTTDRTVVLVRPRHTALCEGLANLPVEIVEVPDADKGMGATLAAGVRATPEAAGWVVALGDMPRIRYQTVSRVVAALRSGASLAAPYYGGLRGHPVGFAAKWRDALAVLEGDEGARSLLRAQSQSIVRIEVNDRGCLLDVDTPDDLGEISERSWKLGIPRR